MKTTKLLTTIFVMAFLGLANVKAQLYTPGASVSACSTGVTGKVGIGLNTPGTNLHIYGSAANTPGAPAYAPEDMFRITGTNSTATMSVGIDIENNSFIRTTNSNYNSNPPATLNIMSALCVAGGTANPPGVPFGTSLYVGNGGSYLTAPVNIPASIGQNAITVGGISAFTGNAIIGTSGSTTTNLTVYGASIHNGNVSIPNSNTLSVGGTSTLTGAVGINTAPGTYQLAVTGTTNLNGNVTIPGTNTLAVNGTSTLTGAVGINTAPGTYQLAVTGTTNLNGNVTIPNSNALTVGGTSTLNGGGALNGTFTGSPTFNGVPSFTGGATIGSTSTTSYLNGIFNCTNATFNGGIFNNTTTMSSLVLGGASISSPSPNYTSPSGLNSTAYNFTMGGNANIKGALVIGDDPSYFNSSTSSAIAAFPTSNNSNSNYSLFVAGGIITEAATVAVANTGYWADFVFDKGYKLTPLKELERFIIKNHHLPEIPSAEEVVKSGVNVAQMDAKLLQKIEELTLYMIEMKKENDALKTRVQQLENKK